MANDTKELPAAPPASRPGDGLHRFLGGSPLAVAFRLALLSILVGVVLAALGFDPTNILPSIERFVLRIWNMGWDAVTWAWRYFLLGAILVVPIWFIVRLVRTPRERN